MTKHGPFLLFSGLEYEAGGGAFDFRGVSPTLAAACAAFVPAGVSDEWAHVAQMVDGNLTIVAMWHDGHGGLARGWYDPDDRLARLEAARRARVAR